MNFRQYLRAKYPTACQLQRLIHLDAPMVEAVQSDRADIQLVKRWMREYGLLQGIIAPHRDAIAARFLRFAREHERSRRAPNSTRIESMYAELLSALHREVPRGWVSATSKLLWCLYPKTIVIYDSFVHRSLVVLQCLEEDLAGFPRIDAAPTIKKESDIGRAVQHYMNYQAMVRKLFEVNADILQELRDRDAVEYPYDIRIVDKLLWMMGNSSKVY